MLTTFIYGQSFDTYTQSIHPVKDTGGTTTTTGGSCPECPTIKEKCALENSNTHYNDMDDDHNKKDCPVCDDASSCTQSYCASKYSSAELSPTVSTETAPRLHLGAAFLGGKEIISMSEIVIPIVTATHILYFFCVPFSPFLPFLFVGVVSLCVCAWIFMIYKCCCSNDNDNGNDGGGRYTKSVVELSNTSNGGYSDHNVTYDEDDDVIIDEGGMRKRGSLA